MILELYRNIIAFYREILGCLQTLREARQACDTAIDVMQQFSYSKIGFDSEIDRFRNILESSNTLDDVIQEIEKSLSKAEEQLGKVEGIDARVIFMRDVEGKKLYEIAGTIGYTYDHVRRVSSRNPKQKHATIMPHTN